MMLVGRVACEHVPPRSVIFPQCCSESKDLTVISGSDLKK